MAKRIIFIALVMMLMFTCVGCNMITVNEERDGQRVVATVNGVDIHKAEVVSQLNLYLSYLGVTEDSDSYQTYFDSMIESYLESSVIMELCRQKCAEFGIEEITEEQQKEIDETLETSKSFAETLAETNILEDDYDTTEQYEAAKAAYVQDYLDKNGYNNGAQEENLKRNAITENVIAYLTKDFDPTEEDVQAYYDQELKDQKTVIDEQLSSFVNFEDDGILLYTPEGISYIKYVYVALDSDAQSEIEDANSTEKESIREEKLKEIEATAKEALAAAQEDFDTAISTYCPEGDAMLKDTALEEGLRIYSGSSDFEGEVASAAAELKNVGDISDLIATDKGYYIIQIVSKVESGEAKFEDVKDKLKERMISEKEESVFTTSTGEWLDEATIKYYKNRF